MLLPALNLRFVLGGKSQRPAMFDDHGMDDRLPQDVVDIASQILQAQCWLAREWAPCRQPRAKRDLDRWRGKTWQILRMLTSP